MTIQIDVTTSKVQMRRCIGLTSSLSIIIGAVIGSGIFISPVAIVRQCHSVGLSLCVWLCGGLLMIGMILSYIELAMMFPRAGGDYAYIKVINGPMVAFLRVYMELLIIRPASCAIKALTTVNYLMVGVLGECDISSPSVKMLSACIIIIMIALNCLYMKYTTTLQNLMTVAKVASLITIISSAIYFIYNGNTENFEHPFRGSTTNPGNISIAIFAGMFSYGGWEHLFGLIEEIKKPERTLPKASIISIFFVIIIYLLTNVAYFSAMQPETMANSHTVAMSFSKVTMGKFARLVPFMVATSTIGSLNCSILGGSRIGFAAARDGLFPKSLAMINQKFLTPWVAMFALAIITFVYLFISDALTLIEYQAFIAVSFHALTVADLVYLRYKRPDLNRPFRVFFLVPIFVSIVILLMIIFGMYRNPLGNSISVMILLSGIPIYSLLVKDDVRPDFISKCSQKLTIFIQKTLLVVAEEH